VFSETAKRMMMFVVAVVAIAGVAFWSITSGNSEPDMAARPSPSLGDGIPNSPTTDPVPTPSPSRTMTTEPKKTEEEIALEFATYSENAEKYLRAINTYNTAEQPWQIEDRIAARDLVSPNAPRTIFMPPVVQPSEGPCSGAKGCDVKVVKIVNVLDEVESAGETNWTGMYQVSVRYTPLDGGKAYEVTNLWMITATPGDPRPVNALNLGEGEPPQD